MQLTERETAIVLSALEILQRFYAPHSLCPADRPVAYKVVGTQEIDALYTKVESG